MNDYPFNFQDYWTPGERKLFFVDVKENHWDYYEHYQDHRY